MHYIDDFKRYDRQIIIPEIGISGQEKLRNAHVFIAGAGGLGAPISMYLAAAGVGTIRIVDHDRVDLSNLNRQLLHGDKDVGRNKIDSAANTLNNLNPTVRIDVVKETITKNNVAELVSGFDVIMDAMDNMPTRYLLNKTALDRNIPFFHGAVHGFEGRAMTIVPGESACLRCMYTGPIPREIFPVIGVAPAIIGAIQATEAIKYIVGIGELLINRLLIYDGLALTFLEFEVKKNPDCKHCGSHK